MRAFWNAATALDPNAVDLTEDRRFPFCTQDQLVNLATRADLQSVVCTPIEAPTVFKDFDDYWHHSPWAPGRLRATARVLILKPVSLMRKLQDRLLAERMVRSTSRREHGQSHPTHEFCVRPDGTSPRNDRARDAPCRQWPPPFLLTHC